MVSFFIQRPIFASAIAAILVLAGAICYFLLPVSQFPEITPPQIVVSANYPGAGAQVVADTVTTPLEEQINGVEGMTYMSSSSSNDGSSTITVTFNVGYPLDIAAVDVQNRVSQAASSLPAIVNQGGVTIKKQNPNFVLIVNLTSPDHSVDQVALSNYAYLQIVDQLKRLPGVGDVQIFGERRYSMRVWLDPDKLANLGVTAIDVQNAIAEQNVQVAAGKIGAVAGAGRHAVRAAGQRRRPAFRSRRILQHHRPRRSGERRGDPAARRRARRARRAAIFVVRLFRQGPDGRPRRLPDARLERARSAAPGQGQDGRARRRVSRTGSPTRCITTRRASSRRRCATSSSRSSRRSPSSSSSSSSSCRAGGRRSFRRSPFRCRSIATLAVMEVFGFSLNMLSLLGMVLAIGLVVDDAIVVVENVERQLEAGLPPLAAAKKAMAEVTGPIIATTAVLMAVFVPVAFIPGVAGRLYNQFALTVAISVGISAFNSLTLSPALSAAMLRHGPKGIVLRLPLVQRRLRLAVARLRAFGQAVRPLRLGAGRRLRPARRRRLWTVARRFRRPSCRSRTRAISSSSSSCRTARRSSAPTPSPRMCATFSQATPGVQIAGFISGLNFLTNAAQSNSAVEFAILKPWDERGPDESASNLVAQVRPKLLAIPDAFALSFDPPSVNGLGATGGFEFEVEDFAGARQRRPQRRDAGPDRRRAPAAGAQSAIPVHLVFGLDAAALLRPRPAKAKLLGLTLPDIFNTLQIDLGSLYVNDFNLFGHTSA